ncbi:MAG: hypothetical protein QM817_10295 [Archangium sp.]
MTTPAATTTPSGTTPPPAAPPPAAPAAPAAGAGAGASVLDQALAKPAEGSKAGESAKPGEAAKPPEGAKPGETAKPAALEFKLPEGVTADDAQLSAFKSVFTDVGLDSAKAQKVVDQYFAFDKARTEAQDKAFATQDAAWQAEISNDPDLGGAKLPTTVLEVRKAVQFIGGDAAQLLKKVGIGNNPSLVRALVKIGRAVKDDSIVGSGATPAGGGDSKAPKSDADIF